MKSAATNSSTPAKRSDFYRSTLAPVNHQGELKFCTADAVMLIVLFLEVLIFARLFLAN
jgi:hypothetical protein